MSHAARTLRLLGLAALVLLTAGCVRGCKSPFSPIHINPNMDFQEKLEAQEASDFFYDGRGMRLPVTGTVARGELRENVEFFTGKNAAGEWVAEVPIEVDEYVLARGKQRYEIYCQVCHDRRGTGQGVLFQYGKVPTATFHDAQRSALTVGEIYDVIVNGKGLMKGYRYPIPPADRWAIITYVRVLQEEEKAAQARMAAATN